MADDWVRWKTDRIRRFREHAQYLLQYGRELLDLQSGGLVIDLGPGPGELLEIARAMGFDAKGYDSKDGVGGMGPKYCAASRLMHTRQRLDVCYGGLDAFIHRYDQKIEDAGRAMLINSRGSIEQAMSRHMSGPPHNWHHNVRLLSWKQMGSTFDGFVCLFVAFRDALAVGGSVLLRANGSANDSYYDRTVIGAASEAGGLKLVMHEKPLLHKFVKTG